MRIGKITLRLIELELVRPFETSFGRESKRRAIIVTMEGDGQLGYGECVAGSGPWYSYETTDTAWHVLEEYMIPGILGKEIKEPGGLLAQLSPIRGHNMAKAALEMTFWDLMAELKQLPLSQLLGGVREEVESGVSIGIQQSIPKLLEQIDGRLKQGYRRVKLKIKPGWDIAIVKSVRERFPDILLSVDANSAYTLDDLPLFKELDRLNLLMIEQPLGYDDLADHAKLQQELSTSICLDESIKSLSDAKAALNLGSCRIINIKPGRVGGLAQAIAIHNECQAKLVPVWCGGMLETGIGRAHNLALASLPGFSLPNDISASDRYYRQDLVEPSFKLNSDGTITVPESSGIGVEVLKDRLEEVTKRVCEFIS